MHRPWTIAAICILLLGVLGAAFVHVRPTRVDNADTRHCLRGQEWKSCNEAYYSAYAKKHGVQNAIARITTDIALDRELADSCHSAMHEIGHVAAKAYSSLGSAFDAGTNICANGFYHGVVEQLFGDDDISLLSEHEITSICSMAALGTSSPLVRLNCVHGIGHALMYMTEGDTPLALLYCEDYSADSDISQCATGALMEEGLRVERSTSSEKFADPTLFCSQVLGDQNDCWLSQSAKIIAQKRNVADAKKFCEGLETPLYRDHCLSTK